MIKHFLVQDFRDSLVIWIIFAAVAFVLTSSYFIWPNSNSIIILGFSCFMFSVLQTANIVGTVIRSDHILSRHYYLTLPLKRHRMFSVIILRLFVFFLPLWLFCTVIAPLTFRVEFSSVTSSTSCYLIYVFGITLGIFWFLGQGLLHSVILQQSLHFSSSKKRILSALIPAFVSIVEMIVIFVAFYFSITTLSSSEKTFFGIFFTLLISLPVPIFLTLLKLRLARNRWTSLG
ncbi:MAG: hypothetical protein ACKN9V_01995 [Pseudomonadota bacterium]